MIDDIIRLLCSEGLLAPDARISWYVAFGRSTNIQIFENGALTYNVKVSAHVLDREFGALLKLRDDFSQFVPEPIRLLRHGNLNVMVSRGVRFVPVRKFHPAIVPFLQSYFRLQERTLKAPGQGADLVREIQKVLARYGSERWSRTLQDLLDNHLSGIICKLRPTYQHGDFVRTNIGRTSSGFVIYDWEEFGKVMLPGFDLFLFVAAFYNFDMALTESWFRGTPGLQDLLSDTLGIGLDEFLALWPVYLAFFLEMKQVGYTEVIQGTTLNALTSLTESARQKSGASIRQQGDMTAAIAQQTPLHG